MSQCIETVTGRVSVGILGRGTESFRDGVPHQCPRGAVEGATRCAQHQAIADRRAAVVAARRAAAQSLNDVVELP